jgi:hypothetical protein
MARKVIVSLTNGSLVLAFILAIVWLWTGRDGLEAAATVSALFAAIAGVRVERWAGAREQRKRALEALMAELERNKQIIAGERFQPLHGPSARRRVFPRLNLSAVDAAVISGALESRRDQGLLHVLYQWRDSVRELNHRLDLTEVYLFSADVIQTEELEAFDEALHSTDGIFTEVATLLDALTARLSDQLVD